MTREEFSTEFVRGMRFLIQKHDRVNAMLGQTALDGTDAQRRLRVDVAQINLDAAIVQLADHVYDALAAVHSEQVEQPA